MMREITAYSEIHIRGCCVIVLAVWHIKLSEIWHIESTEMVGDYRHLLH